MTMLYLTCAVVGGTVMVCQFVLTMIGIGGDHAADVHGHDVAHDMAHSGDHDSTWLFSKLSIRAVVSSIAFFGIGGMASQQQPAWIQLGVAVACGAAAIVVVNYLLKLLAGMQYDGTLRIEQALGARGTVYIPIPADRANVGKVQLHLRNRIVEYAAVTAEKNLLPTGAKIVVTALVSHDTVEVAPLVEGV